MCLISPLRQTGLLVMGPENSDNYQQIKDTLQRHKVPMVILNQDNFSQHIPHVHLGKGDGALVDITAGVLYADRALKTAQVGHYRHRYLISFKGFNFCLQNLVVCAFLSTYFFTQTYFEIKGKWYN